MSIGESGATQPAQQQPQNESEKHPDFQKPPAVPGEKRASPVYMMPDDLAAMQKEIAEARAFRVQWQAEAEAKEQERLKALAAKGQSEEALKQYQSAYEAKLADRETKYKNLETKWLEEKRNAVITDALTGLQFTGPDPQATAAHLRRLLEGEIEATLDNSGNPVVRDRQTYRPAGDFLKERLASPEFSYFFKADQRGGSGSDGSRAYAPVASSTDPYEAYAAQFRKRTEAAFTGHMPNITK